MKATLRFRPSNLVWLNRSTSGFLLLTVCTSLRVIVEEWCREMGPFEALQRKSKVLCVCEKHMERKLQDTFSFYPPLLWLAGVIVEELCSDDGPKQSSSSLWTSVMRISGFLMQRWPIKGVPTWPCLFLGCESLFVSGHKDLWQILARQKSWLVVFRQTAKQLKWNKKKEIRAGYGKTGAKTQRASLAECVVRNVWQWLITASDCETQVLLFGPEVMSPSLCWSRDEHDTLTGVSLSYSIVIIIGQNV